MKKGYLPIIIAVVAVLIYEFIVIFILNWTGISRSLVAGLVGGLSYNVGKIIEKRLGIE